MSNKIKHEPISISIHKGFNGSFSVTKNNFEEDKIETKNIKYLSQLLEYLRKELE